jgi:hypothetical protein
MIIIVAAKPNVTVCLCDAGLFADVSTVSCGHHTTRGLEEAASVFARWLFMFKWGVNIAFWLTLG